METSTFALDYAVGRQGVMEMTTEPDSASDKPAAREAFRREYFARIHRAQDYIENNLAGPLSLEQVARAANFSPFHFHRIYLAVTGETLYHFIQRIRLERAASVLRLRPDQSITSIALDHGFGSSATFARAFKAFFGVSAGEFRRGANGKIGKTLGKFGKEAPDGVPYASPFAFDTHDKRSATMNQMNAVQPKSIEVRDMPAKSLAYVRHVGPYAGDMALFGRLWDELSRWAMPRDLFKPPQTEVITVYHENPEITPEEKLRISFGITVPDRTPVSGTIGLMEIPAGKYVCALFEIDVSEYVQAWILSGDWLPQNGWQPGDGPCYESYLNDPCKHPQNKHIVEIRINVSPLA